MTILAVKHQSRETEERSMFGDTEIFTWHIFISRHETDENHLISFEVNTLNGTRVAITAPPTETLEAIKLRLQIALEGMPPNEMRLLLDGAELDFEELSIQELGVENGTVLHLVLRLPPTKEELIQKHEARVAREIARKAAEQLELHEAPARAEPSV